MPHLSIEYSANLNARIDIPSVCSLLKDVLVRTGLFELGAIRVRAFCSDTYAVADELPQNGFIDLQLRIGRGRSIEERKRVGEAIVAAVRERLAPEFEAPHFALSLEIREIDPELSWKLNAIHPRLRGR